MHKLWEFIRSVYVVVLFVLLEVVAVSYYAHSTFYTQARLLSRSNQVVGSVHGLFAGVRRYFLLGRENRLLLDRVSRLEERLAQYDEAATSARLDSYIADIIAPKYRFLPAMVVANTVNRSQNMLTINRGRKDGVIPEMAVLGPDGSMVGFVVDCSERYSVAMSVLNTSFRASGKLAGSDYLGSIYWDGLDQHVVVMDEISKYADPQLGQEVVTAGFLRYFPPDVLIGWVESFEMNEMRTAYRVRVRLAAEMSRMSDVTLVENRDLYEIRDLQQSDQIHQYIRENK